VPTNTEVAEVEELTAAYLDEFVATKFANLLQVETTSGGSFFQLAQPFEMNYTSTAIFDEHAAEDKIPTSAELDLVLMMAFDGKQEAAYVDLLQQRLPRSNILQTTTKVLFNLQAVPPSSPTPVPGPPTTLVPTVEEPTNGGVPETGTFVCFDIVTNG